jgi:DDE family transposase
LSRDGKATVKLGACWRGGKPRGEHKASDPDFGGTEPDIPCGLLDENPAQRHVTFGSSATTSDFLVAPRTAWWPGLTVQEQGASEHIQLKMDNGPESSGVRTQFLHRRVQLVDTIGKPVPLLYYPPYHSKYNPLERGWGMLELPGNGTQLRTVATRLEWAHSMTWTGLKPVVELRRKVYAKGVTLSKTALQAVEARLERNPLLPKWDILIHPARAT